MVCPAQDVWEVSAAAEGSYSRLRMEQRGERRGHIADLPKQVP